jgi:hypothetical protein
MRQNIALARPGTQDRNKSVPDQLIKIFELFIFFIKLMLTTRKEYSKDIFVSVQKYKNEMLFYRCEESLSMVINRCRNR